MQRDIKFRVWNGEEMLSHDLMFDMDWTYADLLSYEHIMQYTGLKDKNGVDIYEGDILSNTKFGLIYKCQWCHSSFGIQIRGTTKFGTQFFMSSSTQVERDLEVIGNIYENSDLLK